MDRHLDDVLNSIGEEYRADIIDNARHYIEVDIGRRAEAMGFPELKKQYSRVNAIVPLKHPVGGMKVRIDGRTFVDYAQYESGIAVPGYVAKQAGLPHRAFVPNDSMILNFV